MSGDKILKRDFAPVANLYLLYHLWNTVSSIMLSTPGGAEYSFSQFAWKLFSHLHENYFV